VAALPADLPTEISAEILRGGAEKCREAGVVVAGGHTVQDKEPKFGLVALGFLQPGKMVTKGGARPSDRLVLTKPLGFGVTSTALKRGQADPDDVEEIVRWMSRLNRDAGRLAVEFSLRGGTDVTGFGLLGHGLELAEASVVSLLIRAADVPFVSGARGYAEKGTFPGGSLDNRNFFGARVAFSANLNGQEQMLFFDAQTSGGLLLAVPQERLSAFMSRAREIEQPAWVIGEVLEGSGISVV